MVLPHLVDLGLVGIITLVSWRYLMNLLLLLGLLYLAGSKRGLNNLLCKLLVFES